MSGRPTEDIDRLKEKAKVCDILVKIAYEHFYWGAISKIKLTDEIFEIDPDDYSALRKEMLEYRLTLDKEVAK